MSARERLHVAVAIPPFGRGSGGHSSIFQIVHWLERMGHTCSIWVHDPVGIHRWEAAAVLRQRIVTEFVPLRAPVFKGFAEWHGADVAVATGWETVAPVLLLGGTRARAYLVHDHEPEFFATSAERIWADQTYHQDLYPISSSRWLRDLMRERYGHDGSAFRFGVDHSTYRPRAAERRRDTILFYGRDVTARRAVPLGMLALDELSRRRPGPPDRDLRAREAARHELPLRAPRHREPRGAGAPLLGGARGPLPVADELLADPAGDDGLRAALRGPRRRQPRGRVRHGRAGGARAPRTRSRWPTRWSACWTTTRSGASAPRPGSSSCAARPGSTPGGRSRRGCARRWPSARPRLAAAQP